MCCRGGTSRRAARWRAARARSHPRWTRGPRRRSGLPPRAVRGCTRFGPYRVASLPRRRVPPRGGGRSEEHTSELQSRLHLVCRLLLEKKKKLLKTSPNTAHQNSTYGETCNPRICSSNTRVTEDAVMTSHF